MLKVELLSRHHDRGSFTCGKPALDDYLRRTARQHLDKGVSRTFVLVDDELPGVIMGFFALSVCELDAAKLPPKWGRRYPRRIPGAKLARLAVDERLHGQGYGAALLYEAMRRVVLGAEQLGVVALFVDSKDEEARRYYEHFGFLSLPENHLEMYLPMETVRSAVLGSGAE